MDYLIFGMSTSICHFAVLASTPSCVTKTGDASAGRQEASGPRAHEKKREINWKERRREKEVESKEHG